jgi:hypothetical protein
MRASWHEVGVATGRLELGETERGQRNCDDSEYTGSAAGHLLATIGTLTLMLAKGGD